MKFHAEIAGKHWESDDGRNWYEVFPDGTPVEIRTPKNNRHNKPLITETDIAKFETYLETEYPEKGIDEADIT